MNRMVPVAAASWERGKSVADPRFPPVCPAQVTPQGTENHQQGSVEWSFLSNQWLPLETWLAPSDFYLSIWSQLI